MTRPRLLALLSIVLLAGFGSAHAQSSNNLKGDKQAGKTYVYTCAGCHGIPGYQNAYPTYHVPLIAGQNQQYVSDALHEYQQGIRKHPTMDAQAEDMTDQDIANIAAYLSSLKPAKLAGAHVDTGPGAKKSVTCQACHGKYGIAVASQYPDLAGQHADYIVQVLHEYKDGQRDNAIMKGFASQLSEQDMQDIANYFAAQPSPLSSLQNHIEGSH
ncbi:MAG TPA: cytochrome c [Oleiagrimonas sp.]|nr:cytochrome c [Oleiagrimonas sp.]